MRFTRKGNAFKVPLMVPLKVLRVPKAQSQIKRRLKTGAYPTPYFKDRRGCFL